MREFDVCRCGATLDTVPGHCRECGTMWTVWQGETVSSSWLARKYVGSTYTVGSATTAEFSPRSYPTSRLVRHRGDGIPVRR